MGIFLRLCRTHPTKEYLCGITMPLLNRAQLFSRHTDDSEIKFIVSQMLFSRVAIRHSLNWKE